MILGARLARSVRLGVSSLLLHKLRSALTTLGVLFGVSSVIAMRAIGEGASAEAQEQIRQLGSRNVILRSVKPPEDPNAGSQTTRISSYGLKDADLERIASTFPGVRRVVPVRELYQEVRVGERALNPRVLATLPSYVEVTGRVLAEGRFLAEEDERNTAPVCVVSWEVARQLFPFESALQKRIRVGSDYFTVIGTLLPRLPTSGRGSALGDPLVGEIFLPLATGRRWFGELQVKIRSGSREMEEVQLTEIVVDVASDEAVPVVAEAAREMLRRSSCRSSSCSRRSAPRRSSTSCSARSPASACSSAASGS
jgi:putative ABC transport system permease protein